MTQNDCLKVLKGWMTSSQITKRLNQDSSSVNKSLRRLHRDGEVERRIKVNSIPKLTYEWRKR